MQRLKRRFLQLTVGVGPVVFQVFGHDMTGVSHLQPAGIKRDFARVIWPATGPCYWPLPMALGDEGLRRFARDP
jgi:hypothetical protein